jgi:phosphogluconate 2-dehydrogenase/gluconate 2-dehydrogenase
MNATRKNVVVFRKLPEDLLAQITAQHQVTIADPRRAEELPKFRDALRSTQASSGRASSSVPQIWRRLRAGVISSISVGVDNYDLGYLSSAESRSATRRAC